MDSPGPSGGSPCGGARSRYCGLRHARPSAELLMGVNARQIGLPMADVAARWVEDSATSWVDAIRGDIEHAERLERDLPYFAERCLKLRPKSGGMAAFAFNPAQLELHRRLE